MSNYTQKVEYTCECGEDYGACGKTGRFFLRYQGVSDHYFLFQQKHPDSKPELLAILNEQSLNALIKLLTGSYSELGCCSKEEIELINSIR